MSNYSRPVSPVPAIKDYILQNWLNRLTSVENVTLVTAFQNSWANTGGSFLDAGYYKDPWGRVHLQGTINGGSSGTIALTLPEKYRPLGSVSFTVSDSASTTQVIINTDGEVSITYVSGTPEVHLDSISFRAA